MSLRQKLKELCKSPSPDKAYYRPLICKGELSNVDIFFVGTNPATPIYPKQMNLDTYVDLLMNYDKFIGYYKVSRIKDSKDEISRTRQGMFSFLNWLSSHTIASIAETEVIPYPTQSLKLLKKEPSYIIQRGKEIFCELVMEFSPRLLILHGKKTVEHAVEIFIQKGLIKTIALT
ncbi:hypothetical protein N752_24480 [Desulforamulus aquiferis]|nr:hypothetical protein [Desulforamulus aquiferis]RYD02489.1 hypothetical protein N752_24480 [Desulforamulus aquiferis]